jgi:hypothetical protein
LAFLIFRIPIRMGICIEKDNYAPHTSRAATTPFGQWHPVPLTLPSYSDLERRQLQSCHIQGWNPPGFLQNELHGRRRHLPVRRVPLQDYVPACRRPSSRPPRTRWPPIEAAWPPQP